MKFTEFLSQYDRPGSIILLEGKRNVIDADQPKLLALGKLLASTMKHATFRSGKANGSDLYFSQGVASIDALRLEAVITFDGHRTKSNVAGRTLSLDEVDLSLYPDIVKFSALNKKTAGLLTRFMAGERNRFTSKVTFIIRDTIKVVGVDGHPPIRFGIFYDDLSAPKSGGTGHTMEVCKQCQVPYADQKVWMDWI